MKKKNLSKWMSVVLSATTVLGSLGTMPISVSAADTYVTDAECTDKGTSAPTADETVPNANQYRYQKEELAAFCHFGPNTFNEIEWGEDYGNRTPDDIFGLETDFDADTYVKTLQDAGFKKLIVVAKHHDGFCLWQSNETTYDVESTSYWIDRADKRAEQEAAGKDPIAGDVLAEISEACTRYDMDMGLYMSPWDIHDPSYGYHDANGNDATEEEDVLDYNEYYDNCLKEILGQKKYGNNGHFVEVWMDGAKGSGANAQEYDFERWFNTIQTNEGTLCVDDNGEQVYDADCMLFGAKGYTTVRWIGNESGYADPNTWSKAIADRVNNTIDTNTQGNVTVGYENGNQWTVPEADARITSGWFWGTQKSTPKSIEELGSMYFNTVGHNSVLLLNVPPNTQGTVDQAILNRVTEFGNTIKQTFANNLAENATVSASQVRGNDVAYKPSNTTDGDDATYWTTEDGTKAGSLIYKFDKVQSFDVVSIEEAIQFGQRITSFTIEYRTGDSAEWRTFASGKTIGGKRLCRSNAVIADQVKITVSTESSVIENENVPMLSEVGIYKASEGFETSSGIPAGMDVIDERDSEFEFSGTWTNGAGSSFIINGTEKWANSGNSFTVTFNGTKIYLIGTIDPGHGTANISIDGGATQSINTNGSSRKTGQIIYTSPNLSDGSHTLTLTTTGTIGVDGAYVINNGGLGMIGIENTEYTMNEDSVKEVKLVRVGGTGEATVILTPNPGSAVQGDFDTELVETVTFAAGETEKTARVRTKRNEKETGDLSFTIELSSKQDVILGFNRTATVTIRDKEIYGDSYTTDSPFVFPSKEGETKTMEAELATEIVNSNDTDSDPNWPFAIASGTWASGGKFLNCMAYKDHAYYAYQADVSGTYKVVATYRSGDSRNKLAWSEADNKIKADSVVAGASDGAGADHTVEFEMVITEAGAGTLDLTAPDTNKGPQLDKLEITLVKADCMHKNTETVDAKEPTCTEVGSTGKVVCKDCGKTVAEAEEIPATGKYTEADPFVFPSTVGETAELEAEHATEIVNSNDTDSDPNWPFAIASGTWASGGKFLNCMAYKDHAYYAYQADVAGTYKVVATYRSGDSKNKLAWSEADNKIKADSVVAGASDGAGADHTVEFEMVITEAGAGTLDLTAPDTNKGPQLDKLEITLLEVKVEVDKTSLNVAIAEASGKDGDVYTEDSWTNFKTALENAEAVRDNADATETEVAEAEAALREAMDGLEFRLTGIEVTTEPDKTIYERGEELNLNGLVVTAHYAGEGEDKVLSSEEYVVTGFDSETAGTKVITVTYGEKTATFNIEVKPCYIVTVDGEEVARGQYNTKVTLTADEKEGQVFAGWMLGETVVSTDAVYTFYMGSDVDLVKKYVDAEEEVTVEPAAIISNVIVTDAVNGKGSVRFVAQLVVPEGYTVEEFGVYWTGKNSTNVPTLVNEDGTVCAPAKKAPAAVKTAGNQFSSTIKNIPVGKTARAVVYMKISDGTTTRWIVSNEQSGTVK